MTPGFASTQVQAAASSPAVLCESELTDSSELSIQAAEFARFVGSFLSQFPNQSSVALKIANSKSKINPFQFSIDRVGTQFRIAIDRVIGAITESDWRIIRRTMISKISTLALQSADRGAKEEDTSFIPGLELRSKLELPSKEEEAPHVITVDGMTYMFATTKDYRHLDESTKEIVQQVHVYQFVSATNEFKFLASTETTDHRAIEIITEGDKFEILIMTNNLNRIPRFLRYKISSNSFDWLESEHHAEVEGENGTLPDNHTFPFTYSKGVDGHPIFFFANRSYITALRVENNKIKIISAMNLAYVSRAGYRPLAEFIDFDHVVWKERNYFIRGKYFVTYDESQNKFFVLGHVPPNKTFIRHRFVIQKERLYISTLYKSTQDYRWDGWDINAGRLKPVLEKEEQLVKVENSSQIYWNDQKNKVIPYRYTSDLFVLSTQTGTVTQLPLNIHWGIFQKPEMFEEADGRIRYVFFKGDEMLDYEYRENAAVLVGRIPIGATPVTARFRSVDGREFLLARGSDFIYLLGSEKKLKRSR